MLFIQERIGASEIKGLILHLPTNPDTVSILDPSVLEPPPKADVPVDTTTIDPTALLPLAVMVPEAVLGSETTPKIEPVADVETPVAPPAVTILAERGIFKNDEGVLTLSLYNGMRENFDPLTKSVSRLEFEQYTLSVPTGQGGDTDRTIPQSSEFSIPSLWEKLTDNKKQLAKEETEVAIPVTQIAPQTEMEKTIESATKTIEILEKEQRDLLKDIHARLSSLGLPMSIILMGFLIILQVDNPRGLAWRRFVAAVVFGIGLQGACIALSYQIVAEPRLIWLLYTLSIAPAIFGLLWIFAPDWVRQTMHNIALHIPLIHKNTSLPRAAMTITP